MATEEEAREAADGEEVQVEAVDLGTTHLQMNLDCKLSSHEEIKGEAKIMDSTEGLLKVTEDQVLEKAPSSVKVPPEDTPNDTASSLNGHMEEAKISDEKPQENGQTDTEQVEASSNGISTDQSNNSNDEEAINSSGHVESTTQDTSLLIHENEEPKEHYQQDVEGAAVEDQMVQEDTLQTDEPTVNAQQGQNLEPAEVIEDTKHASTSCIPHDEVVAEAPAGVQTSLEPNVDDSGALPDASDGNTETEHAKVDKESCPEDEDVAEQTNEIIKPEDQPSNQIYDVDADLVQEEVPKKTDVPEDTIKTEQADESINDDQDELNQESPEDTSDPVYEKTEETSHESNVSTSEETTPEHATTRETALDVQEVQSQGLAEEIEDAKEVDTEKTVQQSGVASEEASPEDNVATIEPSSDIQNLNDVESEEIKVLEDDKVEETSNQSNVIIAEDAAQDKESTEDIQPVKGLEEEPKSTGTVEMDEVSNQPQADVLANLAEEDDAPACQPQVIELEEEAKDIGVTETQEITQQSHVAASKELVTEDNSMAVESGNDDIQQTLEQGSVEVKDTEASETREICHETTISASEEDSAEDNVTAEGPTSDAQEVENRESVEEIKNNTDDNVEASAMAIVEEADQENSMLPSEDVPEQQMRELEPEVQTTEPVEPQGISPSRIASTSEESTPEDNVMAEPSTDTQTKNLESATITEEAKDVMSTDAIAEEETPDEHAQESEVPVHTPPVEEPELEETKNTDNQMDAAVLENPTHEDKPTASELLVMESPEVSSSEATESQEMPKSEVTQSEDYRTEENTIAGEPKILEPELAEEMRDSEAAEPRSISQQNIVSSSEESVPEEDVTIKEPTCDIKEVQTEEPERIEEHNDAKAGEISNQSRELIVGETAQEKLDSSTVTEETNDVESTDAIAEEESPEEHVQESEAPIDTPAVGEPELEETKNTEPAEVHDNVATNDLPAEEVNNTEATEIAEIQNESGDLTEDVKSNVALADEAAPKEDAKATETTADIPQAQEPEQEEIKDSEPVEVEADKIASDLAEEIKDTEAMETELIPDECTSAKITELTNDVKSNVATAEEAAPEEHVTETEATIDIPGAQEPELEEIKNTEPVEVKENISASDLPAKEVKETEVISESIDANISEPTEDAETNVVLADEAALEEHVIATEATDDIPRAQEPELEETKNSEPIEMKENISASDLPAEEVKETEGTETEVISESTVTNISETTLDAETNVPLTDVAAPDEHAKTTEETADKPQARDPELDEIKNSEPIEVEDNIIASDLPEEEIKDTEAMETEVIPDESTSAKITQLTNDVKSNVALAEEAAPEEYVTETEATIHIPGAQEPELEEIKNTEPVEEKESISASDLPAEEVKETEATETELISESTDANISEPTEDAEINVALADKAAPEENVIATEATVDIPRAQEPELEEIENAEHVEVEENISANDLPAEEYFTENEPQMTDIEPARPEPTPNESNVASLEEMATEDNTTILTDFTIQELQEQEPVEFRDTEDTSEDPAPEDNVTTEVSPDTQAENLESAAVIEETKDVKSTDTIAEEETPEEHVQEFESPVDIPPVEQPELEETKNTEPVEVHDNVMTNDLPAEEGKDTQATEIAEIHNESCDLTEDVKTNVALTDEAAPDEDAKATEPTADIPQAEQPELKEIKNSESVEVEDNIIAREMPKEEIKDTETMETEMIPDESTGANISEITDDVKSNVALADEAAPEEHVIATEATIDVPRAQEPKLEEIKNTEPVEVEENISATDQSAEETEATEAMESEAINDSIDANNSDSTEREEASHPSQDDGLEKLVSESNAATLEPTADIQQVSDLDVVEEITAAEAINDEEISCKKTEVATLEDQSPTELDEETLVNEINNADPTEQKDESSDLGEKAAFTTPEGESPTEEDAQTSGEDTVGISNNIEQIKEQSKAVIEHDAIQSADHTNDQDDEQLHNAELQMEVCERSLDVSAIEKPNEDVQKVKDQQQNEDEAIEKQTEEIQSDEQKHDDRSADLTTETLLEPQSSEIDTANLHEDTDVFEPEQALHTPQGPIQSIADVKVEDSTGIEETPEQENATSNTDTLYANADAEKYNECEKENKEIDAEVEKLSIDGQDGPTDETISEEVGNGMASPIDKDLQKSSDPAPSNEEMLENDTAVVHENVEPTVHREERECINKANDGVQAIQVSEEEIVDEVEKKQEMQSEDTDVNNDEVQTKPIYEEASELHSNDSTYSKMDDTMSPYAEMVHGRIDEQSTGIEEVKDNKGFSSTSEYVVEKSEQNDVEDSRRNLEASSVATASAESMNEDKEHHNLALPAYSAVDGKTTEQASASEVTEREMLFPEKPLPTESEEHEESQITKEQDEEDIHEQETGDTEKEEKEDEQSELPVSSFLMNLIMGKENTEPDEAEKKQEETTKDDSCLITSQLEENLVAIPTENKVDNKLIFEQGKHNLEGSEETHDSKLESDEVLSTNTHNLEAPVGENNVQGEVSSELVPGGSGLMTELETRDVELGEKATNSEKGSLNSNLDDSTNPRVSQEDTLEEGRTDLQHESLPEDISSDAVAGQTLLSRELNTSDEKKLPKDNDDLQSPLGTKREEATESSITEAASTIEAEMENVEKEEKKQHTTNRGGGPEGQVENLHDNSQKGAEAISDEQTAEITEPVMGTEISAGSKCEEETQSSKLSNSELHNSEKALDIQSDDSTLHINKDKQDKFAGDQIVMEKNNLLDKPEESNLHEEQETEIAQESPIKSDGVDKNCLAITEPVIKEENANRTVESYVQTVNTKSSEEQEIFMSQVQERGLDVVSAKEAPEAEEDIVQMAKPEFSTDEEQISKEDKSNTAGEKTCVEKTKDEEKAKSFTDEVTTKTEEQGAVQKASHNQTRDLNVVLPTEAPGSEESFMDVKTPEFSTDEEQSPKKDESNMAEEKSYDEKTNSTDEAPMKTEEREAGQKASPKKHNILSGVRSKVKHQLAKVKKAIIGKPGHTKPESPKS